MNTEKKNILVIVCDQLTWRALPYYGSPYAKTPNIDRICAEGMGFDACYCTFPMCMPSRTSFWSGIYPHETNVLANGRRWVCKDLPDTVPTIGSVFRDAGYRTINFGKTHDAGALRGFEIVPAEMIEVEPEKECWPVNYDTFMDEDTANKACAFLRSGDIGDKPLFMVASFNNPHDICNWIGKFKGKHENPDLGEDIPALPENFEFPDIANRPIGVQYICCSHNRQAQVAEWAPRDFRYYLAAYYHFIIRVDTKIGMVMDALEDSGLKENTLVVLMSDHGDSMVARRRVTKQVDLYEEPTRVPFIFSGNYVAKREKPVGGYPVSTLDLFPTLCGFAGIEAPKTLRGVDLSDIVTGKSDKAPDREYVCSEWHTEWGFTVSPGRMIRTNEYKYTYYIEDKAEELFDMINDPYEKINQAKNPAYAEALEKMRALFREQLEKTDDNFLSLSWKADKEWRCHPLGYYNHRGPAAPEAIEPFPKFGNMRRMLGTVKPK